jgi:uncharacterized protein YaeQ
MALRATVYKAELHIADSNRNYYGSHALTVARHPSETDERLLVRLLAFALLVNSDDTLAFTRGLSETDEPDLWRCDLTGAIQLWVETGLPDERRLAKACGRADQVVVLAYGRNAMLWWQQLHHKVRVNPKIRVYYLSPEGTAELAGLAERKMVLNMNYLDDQMWVSSDKGQAHVRIESLQ